MRYVRTERREYERVRARLPITLVSADGTRTGVLTDLSPGGAGLETDPGVGEGEQLTLTIQSVPGHTSVVVDLVVVRSARARRLGLQFLRVGDEERERLARLVHELIRERPPARSPGPKTEAGIDGG